MSIFDKDCVHMNSHGNQKEGKVAILLLKNIPLTFQIEQNGMFLKNSRYKIWILHKKLAEDVNVTVFHISIHISLNIGPRILNPYTPEYPFPRLFTH